MKTMFDQVGDWHLKMQLPHVDDREPRWPDAVTLNYRLNFLGEEYAELLAAAKKGDLAEFLDGLVDLAWVAMGTAHYLGLPFNEAWAEVLRANNEKVRVTVDQVTAHKRGTAEVIRKPEGWRPPDLTRVLKENRDEKLMRIYDRVHDLDERTLANLADPANDVSA